MAEWLKAADCKSVLTEYGGSNPPLPTRSRHPIRVSILLYLTFFRNDDIMSISVRGFKNKVYNYNLKESIMIERTTEKEELNSEKKRQLSEEAVQKVQEGVEGVNSKFETLLRKELKCAKETKIVDASIIVENGEVKKIVFDNTVSMVKFDKQFRGFFENFVVALPNEKLRRLYEILDDGDERSFCKQCILDRKLFAYKLLQVFDGIE